MSRFMQLHNAEGVLHAIACMGRRTSVPIDTEQRDELEAQLPGTWEERFDQLLALLAEEDEGAALSPEDVEAAAYRGARDAIEEARR